MLKTIKLFLFLACASIHAGQELEVRLGTRTQLKPIYLSRVHVSAEPGNQDAQDLRALLAYDLANNGYSSVANDRDALEQKISWPDPKSRVDGNFWKKEGISYVIAVDADKDQLAVTLLNIEKGTSKRYKEIVFTHKNETDQAAVHRLADAIQKDLFGTNGIASLKILFSQRMRNTESKELAWLSNIWMADWNGANARRLTIAKGYCMNSGFLPKSISSDGFFFASTDRGQSKIYHASVHDPKPEVWVHLRGNQLLPAISKDGSQIAFITDVAGRPDLFIQNLDQHGQPVGKPLQIYSAPSATQASPTFSPDGHKIAFVSDKGGTPRIYVLDIKDPREQRRPLPRLITNKNRENTSPSWSPDGKKLAYSARTEGVRQIWIYDFDSDQEWQLTTGPENKENPSWAPDSLHLIYNTETNDVSELFMINLNQQESVRINLGSGQKRFASWEQR